MKITFTLIFSVGLTILAFGQNKQLQSLHTLKRVNDQWETRTILDYFYTPNTTSERRKRINDVTKTFELRDSTARTIDFECKDIFKLSETFDYKNGAYVKRGETQYWEKDNECRVTSFGLVNAKLDTILKFEYLDYDAFGNRKREKYFDFDSNNIFNLIVENEFIFTYNTSNQIITTLTKKVENGISTVVAKAELTYKNGKPESETYYNFLPPSTWKLESKYNHEYKPGVEIHTYSYYSDNANTPYRIDVDSINLDTDGDYISNYLFESENSDLLLKWKFDYFYAPKTNTAPVENTTDLNVKFYTINLNELHFQIKNTDRKNLDVVIYDLYGRTIFSKSYVSLELIEEVVPKNIGCSIFTVFENGKLVYKGLRM